MARATPFASSWLTTEREEASRLNISIRSWC